jgi:hypothetical protein
LLWPATRTLPLVGLLVPIPQYARVTALRGAYPRRPEYWQRLLDLSVSYRVAVSWRGYENKASYTDLRELGELLGSLRRKREPTDRHRSTASQTFIGACGGAVAYFPAYEFVTGPQAPHTFFEPDRRSVSKAGVAAVMEILSRLLREAIPECRRLGSRASDPAASLTSALSEAECEEAMAANSSLRVPDAPTG